MNHERIQIDGPAGRFHVYLARPERRPAAAVVVMQEIFGINADMRETCDRLAAEGFLALCPDLFWRLEPGVELTDGSEAEWRKGFELYTAFDLEGGIDDAAATMESARRLDGASGKVGLMGFCLGGLMSFRTAARHGADAAVAYYGGQTEKYVDEGRQLRSPLLMHLAGSDEYMPEAAQQTIRAVLGGSPWVEMYAYPGMKHAFARNQGAHFDAGAASLAGERTLRFLRRWLDGAETRPVD